MIIVEVMKKKIVFVFVIVFVMSANIVYAQYFGYQFSQPDNSAREQQQRFNDMEQWMRQREADQQLQRLEQQRRIEEYNRSQLQQRLCDRRIAGVVVPVC